MIISKHITEITTESLKKYCKPAACFCIMKLCLIAIQIFYSTANGFDIKDLYDNFWYNSIAVNGYGTFNCFRYDKDAPYAFFPAIPFLIRIFGFYGVYAINQIFHFVDMILVYKISEKMKSNAELNAIIFALCPIGVYCNTVYTEPLFLLLTLLSFYMVLNRRYLLAGALAGLSCTTRVTGAIFCVSLGLYLLFFENKDFKTNIKNTAKYCILGIPLSLLYPAFLYFTTNEPFKFLYAQKLWGKVLCIPGAQFYYLVKLLMHAWTVDVSYFILYLVTNTVEILFTLVVVAYLIKRIVQHTKNNGSIFFVIYSALSLLAITTCCGKETSSHICASYFRYLLVVFPLFITNREYKKSKILLIKLSTSSIVIGFFFYIRLMMF